MNCRSRVSLSTLLSMLIHLLDPLDTDRQSSVLDKKMLPCIVKQSNEYLYRIMPFWRRYCLCVWMAWGALRTQENGSLRAPNFKFSWGSIPPNPPSLVGANHLCKILDPPLHTVVLFTCLYIMYFFWTYLTKANQCQVVGTFWDSSCEKIITSLSAKPIWVPVKKNESEIEDAWAFM